MEKQSSISGAITDLERVNKKLEQVKNALKRTNEDILTSQPRARYSSGKLELALDEGGVIEAGSVLDEFKVKFNELLNTNPNLFLEDIQPLLTDLMDKIGEIGLRRVGKRTTYEYACIGNWSGLFGILFSLRKLHKNI